MQNWEQAVRETERIEEIWRDFYHNSPMREGLLSWYKWKKGASILEWNPGRGALTGFLSRHSRELTCRAATPHQAEVLKSRFPDAANLRVISWEELENSEARFDYVVAVNPFPEQVKDWEVLPSYQLWRSLLAPDGTLLLVTNHFFGIQKSIGIRNTRGWEIDRQGLLDGLGQFFSQTKLYYIFPDFVFPQTIFTDQRPPDHSVIERLMPYARNLDEITRDEVACYRAAAQNGLLENMANSFLAECSNGGGLCDVISATLTLDRAEHALTTRVRSCGLVEKAAMNDQAAEHLQRTLENQERLRARGIRVVPMRPEANLMRMPYIKAPVLTAALKERIQEYPAGFLTVLDQFYQTILASSDRTDRCSERLAKYGRQDWGPLLETAYVEMTPLNCFCDEDGFLFFDQEYVEYNWPAKYILFRALTHLYYFDPVFEQFVPLEMVKERYQLTELWEVFTEMEEAFLQKVHGQGENDAFHSILVSSLSNPYKGAWGGDGFTWKELHYLFGVRKGRQIVLWGTGNYFSAFMERYGDLFPVSFAVDSNPKLWGSSRNGVHIAPPESLLDHEARVIITCKDAGAIMEQLMKLGQTDIRIFRAGESDEAV